MTWRHIQEDEVQAWDLGLPRLGVVVTPVDQSWALRQPICSLPAAEPPPWALGRPHRCWDTDTSELLGNNTSSGVARGPAPLSASYAHVTTCCAYLAGKHWPIALLLSLFNHCCSVDSEMFELYEFTQPSSEGPRCFSWNTGFLHSAVPSDSGSVSRRLLPPSAPQITQDIEFSFFTVFRKRPTNLLCWRFGGSGSGLSILDLSKRTLLISHVFSVASVLPCSPVPRVRVQFLPLQFPNANAPSFINQNKHFKKQFLLISPLQFICHSKLLSSHLC